LPSLNLLNLNFPPFVVFSFTLWTSQVLQPSATVELCINGRDLISSSSSDSTLFTRPCLPDLTNRDALHLIWLLMRSPANDDCIARVPSVEDIEWNRRLSALSFEERLFRVERKAAELEWQCQSVISMGLERAWYVLADGVADCC